MVCAFFFKDGLSMFKFTPFCCPSFGTASECSYCRVCEKYSVPSKNETKSNKSCVVALARKLANVLAVLPHFQQSFFVYKILSLLPESSFL